MRIEIYRGSRIPGELESRWMDLARGHDSIGVLTRSPGWYEMLRAERDGMVAAAFNESNVATCILPLIASNVGVIRGIVRLRALRVVGGDLLGDCGAILGELFGRLLQETPDVDGIWFDHVADEGRIRAIKTACDNKAMIFHPVFANIPHYRLVMPEIREGLGSLRSRETLKKIEGRGRAIEKAAGGQCRLVEIRNQADWTPYSDKLMQLMNGTWQAEKLGHGFSLNELSTPAIRGWLRSFLLVAGGDAIAFALCYQGMGTLIYEKIGYSRQFAKFSPGTLLLYRMLDILYDSDTPKYIDFGEGRADYKSRLGADVLNINACLVARRKLGIKSVLGTDRIVKLLAQIARGLRSR